MANCANSETPAFCVELLVTISIFLRLDRYKYIYGFYFSFEVCCNNNCYKEFPIARLSGFFCFVFCWFCVGFFSVSASRFYITVFLLSFRELLLGVAWTLFQPFFSSSS